MGKIIIMVLYSNNNQTNVLHMIKLQKDLIHAQLIASEAEGDFLVDVANDFRHFSKSFASHSLWITVAEILGVESADISKVTRTIRALDPRLSNSMTLNPLIEYPVISRTS